MSYYPRSKTELAEIGAEAFGLIDNFAGGRKSNSKSSLSTVDAPRRQTPSELFHYKYQPERAHVIRQQVYVSQVQAKRVEPMIDCYEAAKKYGGTVILEYPKKKTARWGFFF